jgi:hypothetical protein
MLSLNMAPLLPLACGVEIGNRKVGCDALAMRGGFVLPAWEKDDASVSVIATHRDMSWAKLMREVGEYGWIKIMVLM